MNVCIDIGNTRCKIGFFENDLLVKLVVDSTIGQIEGLLSEFEISTVIVSSVGAEVGSLVSGLSKNYRVMVLSYQLPLPFELEYMSKDTLGTDRIAAVAGAFHLYSQKNCLVIDVGSCITYDVITKDGYYKGGAISPGIEMKLKSMHTFTARLPLIEQPEWTELPGKDTKTSMINGVLHGTLAEVEGMIDRFASLFPDLQVIMCGGGSKFFESNIKHHIFVRSEMVLIGLNSILRHNERN